jgi:hypothetical protein
MTAVWRGVIGRTGGGGGSMVDRLALRLVSRKDGIGCEREVVEPVERKRPSSSSMGVGGMEGLEGFLRVDVRPNMSSALIGCVSRSESTSKSGSRGRKDFLRKGEGVSVCGVYGEGIAGGVWW